MATRPEEVGTLYVNSHAVAITAVEIERGRYAARVKIVVSDDFDSPPAPDPGSAPISLLTGPEWLLSELRCGPDIIEGLLGTETPVIERRPPFLLIRTQLETFAFQGSGMCELRAPPARQGRQHQRRWFSVKLDLR